MKILNTLEALDFIKVMPNSTTKAWLVHCDNGKEFVVKHGAGREETGGRRVLVAEYLCYLIAQRFRLDIPEHCFIILGRAFRQAVGDSEASQVVKGTLDLCIGSEYIPWTEPFRRKHAQLVTNRLMLSAIFGFDQFVYNPDRMTENPNLLYDLKEKKALMIDHSAAMWSALDQVEPMDAVVIGASEHILCRDHMNNRSAIIPLVQGMFDQVINRYVGTVPGPWFTQDFTDSFVRDFLKTRRDSIVEILSRVSECS